MSESAEEQINEVGPHPECEHLRLKDRDAWRACVDRAEEEADKRYDRWSGDMTRMEGKQVSESKELSLDYLRELINEELRTLKK